MKHRALLTILSLALLFSPAIGFSKMKSKSKKKIETPIITQDDDVGDATKSNTLAVASLVTVSTAIDEVSVRALWVGDEAKDIVLSPSSQNDFFTFITAPHGNALARVTHVYLNAEAFDFSRGTHTKALRSFLKAAHQKGITVEFLTGKPYWVQDTSGYDSAMKRADRMIAFNAASSDIAERFDGLHYDIRPYLNDKWKSNTSGGLDGYNNAYEKNYIQILMGAKQKITQSGQTVTLAVDVPTWFSTSVTDIWNPLTATNSPVSYIALFNFFDTKETFLYGYGGSNKSGGIGPNLARSGGIPMVFGAQVEKDASDALGFFEEDAATMEKIFVDASDAFGTNKQLKGFGVLRYTAYKNLAAGVTVAAKPVPISTPAPVVVPVPISAPVVVPVPTPAPTSAPVIVPPQPTPVPPSAPIIVVTPSPAPAPVVTPAPQPVAGKISNVRAMWIWSEAYSVVMDAAAQTEFFTFLAAPHGDTSARINRVYLNGDGFDVNKQAPQLRAFLKKAHEKGIAIEYLTGNSKWALDGQTGSATDRCDRVEQFNAGTSVSAERFDGIHLDIEPYLLSGWKDGSSGDGYNDAIEQNYLNVMKACRSTFDKGSHGTTLSGDIPTWYSSSVGDIWNVISSANSPMHYLTVMNYFDTDATFLYGYGGTNKSGGVGPNLAKDLGGIPMVFGAETIDLDPASITYAQEGVNALHSTMNKAFSVYSSNDKFGGIAVHHYKTYKALQK